MYRIELLPAAHGDALWIEYGNPHDPVRIVIDGGPAHTYEQGLRARLGRIGRTGSEVPSGATPSKKIDLFVVTHIDCDHIDGAIIFLREHPSLGIDIREIWFNAWQHLQIETAVEAYQPLQGEFLGSLITTDNAFKQRWNSKFAHKAIVVPEEGDLPAFDLPQGGRLTLLSPYVAQLKRLRRKWTSAIRDFNPGDEAAALRRLEDRREYRPPPSTDTFSADVYGADPSAPNASSIAFILEHENRSCLFAGDAHARVLASSLRRLARQRGVDRIRLDAVKLAHHGSMANVSEELLSQIQCDTWLISTNGAVFGHPDRKTVELIGKSHPSRVRVLCNYAVPTTLALAPQGPQEPWTVEYPVENVSRGPTGGLMLDLIALSPVSLPVPVTPAPAAPGVPAKPKRRGKKPQRRGKKKRRSGASRSKRRSPRRPSS